MAHTQPDIQFGIRRIYSKNISFETSNTPDVFQHQWNPTLSLDLTTKHNELEKGVYEVILSVTATVKNNETTAFLVEVDQAGIFGIEGAPDDQLEHILGSYCPNVLYPYAREVISSEVIRGSFPQLALAPINFDALFAQQQEAKKNQSVAANTNSEEVH
jgi:preprotein translocase subunit SecB